MLICFGKQATHICSFVSIKQHLSHKKQFSLPHTGAANTEGGVLNEDRVAIKHLVTPAPGTGGAAGFGVGVINSRIVCMIGVDADQRLPGVGRPLSLWPKADRRVEVELRLKL